MDKKRMNWKALAGASLLGLAGTFAIAPAAQAQAQVSTELCLAIDGSGSIDNADAWGLQLAAYREALADATVIPRDGSVKLSIVLFATTTHVLSEPVVINSEAAVDGLIALLDADTINTRWSNPGRNTRTDSAISTCASQLSNSVDTFAIKKIIDISTDGVYWPDGPKPPTDYSPVTGTATSVHNSRGGVVINMIGIGVKTEDGIDGQVDGVAQMKAIVRPQKEAGTDIASGDGFVIQAADLSAFSTALKTKLRIETVPQSWTVTVNTVTVPNDDEGKFNLLLNGTPEASNVGHGGTTPAIVVPSGSEVAVSETAGTDTVLDDYTTTLACTGVDGVSGTTSGAFAMPEAHVVCTFTNTRNNPDGPNLSVTKDNGVDQLIQGATTVYTVTIANSGGSDATEVSWTDTSDGLNVTAIAPAGASEGSVAGSCTASGCTGITVAVGGSVSYQVTADVTGAPGTSALNTASVTGGGCSAEAPSCSAADEDPILEPVAPGATPVPTMSEWGLILLTGLLAAVGWLVLRRRNFV